MACVAHWHASPRRGESATSDSDTGEIRVPLSLFHVDQHQGDVELVLSRTEAEELHAALSTSLHTGRLAAVGR